MKKEIKKIFTWAMVFTLILSTFPVSSSEKLTKEKPGTDARLSIEHFQMTGIEDISKIAALDILPAMQPARATSDKTLTLPVIQVNKRYMIPIRAVLEDLEYNLVRDNLSRFISID